MLPSLIKEEGWTQSEADKELKTQQAEGSDLKRKRGCL